MSESELTGARPSSDSNVSHNAVYVFGISMVAAMGGLMFGFDLGIITGVIPYIRHQFGLADLHLGWVVAVFELGCMFGAFGISRYADKYGRKKTMIANALLLIASSIGAPLSPNVAMLTVWRFVQGVSVGAASVLSPMYIAEISPARSRGRYVSLNQMTIILGILLATVSGYVFGDKNIESYAWRLMLGSALVPSVLFFVLLFLIPETPRWLVKDGRDDEAMCVLAAVGTPDQFGEIKRSLTVNHRHGHYSELLTPGLFTALMVGVGLAILQQFCGINNVTTYIQVIFEKAKIELTDGLFKGMFVGLVFFIFTFVAIATIDRIGRRKLMLIGTAMMGVILFALAWAFHHIDQLEAASRDTLATGRLVFGLILAYIATFAFTLGPVTWVLLSEIFPNFIREKALSIASCALWTATFLVVLITPYLLSLSTVFNFVLFGMLNVVGFFLVLKWLPETKGRSLEQMEELWTKAK
jgi:SP family arabinose:H+ symporter-like MFS transporter